MSGQRGEQRSKLRCALYCRYFVVKLHVLVEFSGRLRRRRQNILTSSGKNIFRGLTRKMKDIAGNFVGIGVCDEMYWQ